MITNQVGKIILAAQALNASFNSNPQNVALNSLLSVQLVVTGDTISGTSKLQSSVNFGQSSTANWDDVPNSSVVWSATGSFTYNVSDVSFPFYRVVWTNSASSSNSLATITSYVKG